MAPSRLQLSSYCMYKIGGRVSSRAAAHPEERLAIPSPARYTNVRYLRVLRIIMNSARPDTSSDEYARDTCALSRLTAPLEHNHG
jgi:hypothetical protein